MMNKRTAIIVASSFHPRSVRPKTRLSGSPPIWSLGSQDYDSRERICDLLKLQVETLTKLTSECDIYICFSHKLDDSAKSYLNEILKDKSGFHLAEFENSGRSYGTFDKAVCEMSYLYKYLIFLEDDILLVKNKVTDAIKEIETQSASFLSFIGISKANAYTSNEEIATHAHCGCGLALSSDIFEAIESFGLISDRKFNEYRDYCLNGEILFTNRLLKIGKKMIEFPRNEIIFQHAFDYERKLPLKRYPPQFVAHLFNLYHFILRHANRLKRLCLR